MTLKLIPQSLTVALAALALSACGDTATSTPATVDGRTAFEAANDHAIGSVDAPITVTEYSSVACGACGNWHNNVYPEFKAKFIDTGRVRYVVREFPAGNPTIFNTGSKIANCADDRDPGAFFESAKLQFERQSEIFRYLQQAPAQLKDQYVFIAEQGGMTEQEMIECLSDESVAADMETRIQMGVDAGVQSTPTFRVNGEDVGKLWDLEEFEAAFAEIEGTPTPTSGG